MLVPGALHALLCPKNIRVLPRKEEAQCRTSIGPMTDEERHMLPARFQMQLPAGWQKFILRCKLALVRVPAMRLAERKREVHISAFAYITRIPYGFPADGSNPLPQRFPPQWVLAGFLLQSALPHDGSLYQRCQHRAEARALPPSPPSPWRRCSSGQQWFQNRLQERTGEAKDLSSANQSRKAGGLHAWP